MTLAGMGAFLDGYDVFIISGALLLLKPQFHLTHADTGLLGSASFLGALVGAYLVGHAADRLGRRQIFLWDLLLFALVSILEGFTRNFGELAALRLVLGIAVGVDLPISATIIAEFAPRRHRGKLTSMMLVFLFLGGLCASIAAMALYATIGATAWRWMFISGVIPAAAVLFLRRAVPESPRWLFAQGRAGDALAAIREVDTGFTASTGSAPSPVTSEHPLAERGRYREIFTPPLLRITLIIAAMWFLLNTVSSSFSVYTPTILHAAGVSSKLKSLEYSSVSSVITLAATILALLYIDRLGRRHILYACMAATVIGAMILLTGDLGDFSGVAFLVVGVFFAASSLGASGIVFMNLGTELFPTKLRATGEGFAVGSNKLGAYVGTLVIPTLVAAGGTVGLVSLLIGVAVCVVVLITFLGIEPAGKALEDLM